MTTHTARLALILFATALLGGCASTGNVQRDAAIGFGAASGAAAGYGIGKATGKDTAVTTALGGVTGAVIGAAMTNSGNARQAYQQGVDDGYILGNADATKRMYWLKQRLERPQQAGDGVTRYYTYESEGTTSDGRKLAPEKVAIPIFEPNRTAN